LTFLAKLVAMRSKRSYRRGWCFRLEALEPRALLAVIAHDDTFAVAEDTVPNTAPATVIPQYAGLWYVNDELLWSVNQYPTDAASRNWADREYDISTSRIDANPSVWDGPTPGPFVHGQVNAFAGVPRTNVNVPPETDATFLLRRAFELDAVTAEAVWGRITYTCDDGCIIYINGIRAASSPSMAGILSPMANTFVGTTGDEDPPHATTTFGVNGPGQPPLYVGDNFLAVEVHNGFLTSEDIGGDFSLAIAPQGGSVLTNDNLAAQSGSLVLAKLSDPVDETTGNPAGTITLNTDGQSPDFGIFAYNPATNYCGTARWTYQIDDGSRSPSTGTVRLNVACVNDAPAARDDAYSVDIGSVLQTTAAAGLLANDTDAEGDTMSVQTLDTSGVTAQGTLNVNGDGRFTFDPFPTAMPGRYSLTYKVVDSGTPSAPSNVAAVEITITSGCEEISDLDGDGRVGSADFAILVGNFGSRSATPGHGDVDCDGKVGLTDLAALKRGWTPAVSSASAATVVQSAGLPRDVSTRLAAVVHRRTAPDADSLEVAPSQPASATRLPASRRTINHTRRAIDVAFSAWAPT
jgi:hypothetical protein